MPSLHAQTKTSIGTSWGTSSHWSPSGVPTASDNVIINTNMAVALAGVCLSLTVNSGRTLTINSTRSLTVGTGDVTNNGNIVLIAGTSTTTTFLNISGIMVNNATGILTATGSYTTVFFTGTSAQSFTNNGTVTSPLYTLSVSNSNGLTLLGSNQIDVYRVNLFTGIITNSNLITLGTGGSSTCVVQIGPNSTSSERGYFDQHPTFDLGTGGIQLLYANASNDYSTSYEIPSGGNNISYFYLITTNKIVSLHTNITITNAYSSGLNLASGNLNIGAFTLNIEGTIGPGAGTLTGGATSNISFTGDVSTALPAVAGGLHNLVVSNEAGITLAGAVMVNGTLSLLSGILSNGSNLTMADGSTVVRAEGSLMNTPTFDGTVNVTYSGSTAITTGPEIPTDAGVLNNLTTNTGGVVQGTSVVPSTNILTDGFTNLTNWTGDIGTGNNQFTTIASANAGGTANEVRYFYGAQALTHYEASIYRMVNTTGYDAVNISWNQFIDNWNADSNPYTIKVQSASSPTGPWTDIYTLSPSGTANIGPQTLQFSNWTTNIGGAFYIRYYIEGYTYGLNYWYFDDLIVDGVEEEPSVCTVNGTLNLTDGTYTIDGNNLVLNGDITGNSAIIGSAGSGLIVGGAGSTLQIPQINSGLKDLIINRTTGVSIDSDLTVYNTLNLQSSNPSASQGVLTMGTDTLFMGANAVTIGQGDATGIVKRTSITHEVLYTFGNQFTTVKFPETGTLPSEWAIKTTIGQAPAWKGTAIQREYDIVRKGGSGSLPAVRLAYKDDELNGNIENQLVFWGNISGYGVHEYGRVSASTTENWVGLIGSIEFAPTTFGTNLWTLAQSESTKYTWIGTVPGDETNWNANMNWVGSEVPDETSDVLIPAGCTHYPTLPGSTSIKTMTIEEGAVVNGGTATSLTITGGSSAWFNDGTFNPGTSTVSFTNSAATIAGETDFYNVTIGVGASLTLTTHTIMRIAGELINNGVFNADLFPGTVEYNGGDQNIVNPNGTSPGYHHLILSGSGVKSMPVTGTELLSMHGNLSIIGTAAVAAAGPMEVHEDLLIGADAAFNAGSFTHIFEGDWTNEGGTFTPENSTLVFNGSGLQNIICAAGFEANNLTISNTSASIVLGEDTDCSVGGDLIINAGAIFNLSANRLISVDGAITNTGTIRTQNISASPVPSGRTWGGSFVYAAATSQTAVAGTYNNLTVSGTGGAVANGNITVNGILNLATGNPSLSRGILEMATTYTPVYSSYVLFMGADATTIGPGDATGIVTRNTIDPDIIYSFGNRYSTIMFPDEGTLPTSVSLKIVIGTAPDWKADAIFRTFDLVQTGGSNTKAVIQAHYKDAELNGNPENSLVNWVKFISSPPPGLPELIEYGRGDYNTTENWVSITNVNVGIFTPVFGYREITLAESRLLELTWNGSVSTSWSTAQNWTPNGAPSDISAVTIPDAGTTAFDPELPVTASCKTILIQSGGVLNTAEDAVFTVNGADYAWNNQGGIFNAGNSEVIFTNGNASMGGYTTFYNITVQVDAELLLEDGTYLGINGAVNNAGPLHPVFKGESTVEYKGGNQVVVVPNPTTNRYSTLILSGTGTKIMPNSALQIVKDFNISGTASATAGNALTFSGNVMLGSGSSFDAASYSHSIAGDWTNNGAAFVPSTSTLDFNGDDLQLIGSVTGFSAHHLTISNTMQGVVLDESTDCSLSGNLTVTEDAIFNLAENKLTSIAGALSNAGAIITENASSTPVPAGLTWGGNFGYTGSVAQTAVAGTFNNLVMSGDGGATAAGNISVNGILELMAGNPTATKGILDMDSYILHLGTDATTTGFGDVTGAVKRSSFTAGMPYTFGSQHTTLSFSSAGTLPTEVSVKTMIGEAPSWKTNSIERYYDIARTGGSDMDVAVSFRYLDSELNNNSENDLSVTEYVSSTEITTFLGRSGSDTFDNYLLFNGIDINGLPTSFGERQWTLSNQSLTGVSVEGNGTTTSNIFETVGVGSVTVDVTGANKVYVIATFTSKTESGSALAGYRTADNADPNNISSGEIHRSHNGTYGIGSVVHLFDVSQLSGNRTYVLQHKTDAGTLYTAYTLTAIVLFDGTDELNSDLKILSEPASVPASWETLIESSILSTTGGFYIAAVTNSQKTSGADLSVGEWKLQYIETSVTNWRDLSYTIPRSTSGTGMGVIKLVGFLPNNISGEYKFRVVHRKTVGEDPIISVRTQLVVIALGTENGFFPAFNAARASSTTSSTSLSSILEDQITPQSNTDIFLHAQYGCTSDGISNAPFYDVFVNKDAENILDGMDHYRALSNASDLGSGVASGLATGLESNQAYRVGLRHASTTGRTLTTTGAYLCGFGLNRSSLPFIAPITVNATDGLTSAVYSNLKTVFDEINLGIFHGDITIEVNQSLTETSSCVLNASGTGNAAYSSIIMYPTAPDLIIGGAVATQLIDLNGTDNFTIDGRVNLLGDASMSFVNTNTAGSVFRFINDATNNTLRYCNVRGVIASATSGLIVFSTGSIEGNDNNTIEYCNISDGNTTPTNAIYSAGSSVAADNSNITISNCNISDYFSATGPSAGIYIASNSSAWNITGNKFYQSDVRTATTAATHWGIRVVTASGVDYTINNNVIGFADAESNGVTTYSGNVAVLYRGIEITAGLTSVSSIQGNTIAGISLNTTSGSTTLPGIFSGISVLAGTVNIGTTAGNTIGASAGNGSVVVTSTTSLGVITGIYYTATSSGSIQNNLVGSVRTGGTATIGYTFNGIYTAGTGGNFIISNNIIGSISTANSIAIGLDGTTTTPVCTFRGIYNLATGTISITNNTIQNCSVFGTGASVFSGILNSAGSGTLNITGNKVISGTNTGTGTYIPITTSAAVATLNLNNNIIRNQIKTATSGTFTALSNSGAVLTFANINHNQLGNADGGLVTYVAANSGALLGISNSGGAATCELSIQNNDIRGIEYAGAAGTNAHTYIINSAATLKQEINNNTFTALNVNTSGAIIFISNSLVLPANSVQNVNNNSIVTSYTRTATSGAITLFTSTAATTNANVTVNNNNNNFSNISISGTATISGWINTDAGTGNVNKTISGNVFENWTGGTGAITALNVNITSENNRTKNNTIKNISSAGIIYGIITAAGNDSIYSNTIDQLFSQGGIAATIVSGINVTGGIIKNILNNSISNLTGNSLTTGSVRGILISAGSTVNVRQNKIFGITANANTTGTVSGIWVSAGGTVNMDRNKIYDISSTSAVMSGAGAVYGIQVSGTTASLIINISNNLIADLRTPVANSIATLRGIGIINTGANSSINLYYNSIYLNAESTGTNFGTSGVFHTASSTASTARLDMRNNIIVNLSTPKGTGQTVVFRRSTGGANTLNNYATTSNNNLFYAGEPGATRLIYADGTSTAQTMAAYKSGVFTAGTIAPRDQASVTENPPFLSTDPEDDDFLKINPVPETQIESGAANISSFTVDYAGAIRQGNDGYTGSSTSAPDIGAFEGDYVPNDRVPPSISYTPITNNSCVSNKILSAVITDGTGVNIESGTAPRIYFKKSTNANSLPATNDNTTNGWKFTETTSISSPFSFSINFSLIHGGVTTSDVVQYFIVAQDILVPPYIGINAGTFAAMPASVALTTAAFPIGGTINSFTILAGLSNTVTIGATGDFTSLTGTGGLFSEINAKGLSGNLVAKIIDASVTETGAVSLNQILYGCDDNYTLTIRPDDGVAATLSGTVDGNLIHLSGADYVIFDGINSGGSSLTISNASTVATASTIRFSSDASNNTVINCTIEGSPSGAASGIVFFSTGVTTGNDDNTISNNTIRPAGANLPVNAIYSAGTSVNVDNSGNVITGNHFQDYFNPALASNGIYLASNSSAWNISGNKFFQTASRTPTAALIHRAINILTASGVGYTVSNNIIGYSNAGGTGTTTYSGATGFTYRAIEITAGATIASNIQGNTVSGIALSTTSGTTTLPGIFSGISVLAGNVNIGTTSGNTIGAATGNSSISITSTTSLGVITGIYATSPNTVTIRNNHIGSISTGGTATIGYTFRGIHTAGGGQHTIADNTIGSTGTANSISIGTNGVTTTPVCTFVGISNAATGNITITGNTIINTSAFGTGASVYNGIQNSGICNTVLMDDNKIIQATISGTGALNAIINSAAATNLHITNNEIRNLVRTATTGLTPVISNTGAVLSAININNNKLGSVDGGLITFINAIVSGTGSPFTGISNTGGAASCELSIQNNDIRGISYSVASANANTFILNSAATFKQNISNNTFTNLSVNTSGTIIFIQNSVVMPTDGVQDVNGNSISGTFTRIPVTGAITLFTSTAATNNTGVTVNHKNNDFSNITVSGAATIAGWVHTDAGSGMATKIIEGNTFSNWTGGTGAIIALNINTTSPNNATRGNNINNITSAGNITGITTGAGNDNIVSNTIHTLVSSGTVATIVNGVAITTTGTSKNVSGNIIYNLQANNITTGSVSGIAVSGGLSNFIYNNKIYNLSSGSSAITTGSINGILVSGSVADMATTIYNNRIADLRATAANAVNPIIGIGIINTGLRSSANIYYNTVFLNAPASSGTNFGSSGILHTASAIATTARLDLRNNIIVNISEPKGTGTTVAFRRSAGTANMLNNYATASNNNLFYAGVPGATNLIYTDGTNTAQTIEEYKSGVFTAGTIAPRDQASITESPHFLSIDGSQPDFMKISTLLVTFIESGATNIEGITSDYDGDIRAGNPGYPVQQNGFGTAPDIGADEFDGLRPRVVVSGAHASSNGNFENLAGAFAAINPFDQTGKDVLVSILESTDEPGTASLTFGAWNSLKVFPKAAGITISGNVDGAPLIELNGADNLVIDGRVNQTGTTRSLSIVNTSTSGAGTSTIKFTNSAENNMLKYCIISGSSQGVTDGIVLFSTSASGNGNDNNVIEYCNITNAGGNRPVNAIYSLGSDGSENSGIIIRNNNIFDFLNSQASSNGISLSEYSTEWSITANSFYETTSFVPVTGTFNYSAIRIDNTSGNNFAIIGNYIGGQEATGGGAAWTVSAATNHSFKAIYLNAGTNTASSVQNNTIRNWNYSTASAEPWRAIEVVAGAVNIGTVTGNTIGAATGNGSIIITSEANSHSYGIFIGSTGNINIARNNIGSLNLIGSETDYAHSFTAIYKSDVAGTININNNIIGSSATGNSIYVGSTATASTAGQHVSGIHTESSGSVTINQNTISNLTNAYSGTNNSQTRGIQTTNGASSITRNTIRYLASAAQGAGFGSVVAIELNGTDGANNVSDNGINFISSTGAGFSGYIAGIWFSGNTGTNVATRNLIRNLSVNSATTNATIYGARVAAGATTYSNNIISLGGNTATTLYGIFETGAASNNNNLYFNTVYIGGNLGSGITNKSYAFYSDAANNERNFRNNIFANFRSTTGGSSLHYAAYFNYATSTNLTLDYNNYYAPGTGGVAGYFNGADQTVLPLVPSNDANSYLADPQFVNAGGSDADDYKLVAAINGVFGTGIVLDYGQTARGTPPNVGAWEFNTNRWLGNISTDFADPDNWTSGAVPIEGVPIVFANIPQRDCVLDQDRVVGNIINNQADKKFVINGHQLTIIGGLLFTGGGQIDAGTATSTIVFAGNEEAQLIPDGAFVNNLIPNLIISNEYGVVSESDLTINETLNLQSANPSDTQGCLHTGTKVITLGADAVTIGDGDVSGIVKRTSIVAEKTYTFGNKNAKIFFPDIGTLPTEMSVKITIGMAPSWESGAVKRIYDIIQTGANPLDPTAATIFSTYLDSELNGNDEDKLVNWSFRYGVNWLFEHGRASYNSDENWIKLTYINMAFFPSSFGMLEIGIDEGVLETLTWNGSVSTSWTTVQNWTPMGAPSDYINIIIPDASTTPNDPIFPPETTIKTLKLESGAILNSIAGAQATIIGGEGAWENEGGTFNPGTSNVTFKSDEATISGSTDFYNVTIDFGAILWMKNASAMRISGSVSNNGTWRPAVLGSTTVEYNGGNQVVVVPNPATNRYSTLILSGSGTKTMPSTTLSVLGDLLLSGTVNVTALNNLVVVGSFSIGADASFITGSKNHSIGGNFTHNGSFNSMGSTFTFNGFTPQIISGSSPSTIFENLTILNDQGVTSSKDITVNGNLDLQSENPGDFKGCLDMGIRTLSLGATTITSGPGDVTGIVKRAHTFESGQTYTFGNRFTSVTFSEGGTKPTEMRIKTTIGNAPAWKTSAIERIYDFSQTGGSNCFVDVSVNYLESELNDALEEQLVYWGAFGFPTPQAVEWGRSEIDIEDRWVLLRGVPIGLWPSGIGQMEITLAETEHPILTWNGSQSTNWENAYNWTPVGFPTKFTRLIIPDASTTDFDPILPLLAMADEILIETGGVLNASTDCEFQLFNHNGGLAWENNGAFNAENSTVVFIKDGGSIAGETNFYNVIVMPDVELTPQAGCIIRIAGTFVNDGVFDATLYPNTFEYNGSTQTVALPNGVTPGYHSLVLSGSDVKTMPDEVLNIYGNFSVAGTANVTALDDLNISGSLSVGSNATFNTTGNYLTIGGNITHDGVFDASASTVELVGTAVQTINGSAASTIFRDLLIHQLYGAVSNKDITVNRELCLHNTNPGPTTPVLNLTSYILDLGPLAYVSGDGDATGIVRRKSIERNVTYAFGNRNATIAFNNVGTIPTEMSVRISIGTAPAWRPGAIQRVYEIIQTGANPYDATQATIYSAYLDSELNGNDEERLVNWSYRNPPGMLLEHGRSDHNATQNWLELTNINMAFFPSTFGTLYITMDESEIENLTWNGSVSSSWTTVDNWTPNGAPSSFVNVTIPDASTTPNDPYLNYVSEVKTLTIEEGGILNSTNGSVFNIYGGEGAWNNYGTFNPGNTTVIFNHPEATIAGETNFRSLTIVEGATLTPQAGNIMRIGVTLTNNGTIHAAAYDNTIEYNGTGQSVILPNGTTPGYHSLVLSGSGTKILSSAAFNIYGDFSLAGSAQATAQNSLTIGGSLAVGETASFTTGAFSHSIGGDFINDGSFTASVGNTIVMNGSSAQTISGNASPTFNNLTINSIGGVTSTLDVTVNGVLNLQSNNPSATQGSLHMGSNTLHMGATTTTTGVGDVSGIVKRASFIANTSYTFGNQFTTIALSSGGTMPSEIKMRIEIGSAPFWKPEAITRQYDIAQSGGSSLTATLKLHYLDSELNNSAEADLEVWNFDTGTSFVDEIGRNDNNTNENWVSIANLDIAAIPLNFNDHLWSLYSAVFVVIEDVKGWRMIASPTATTYSDLLDGFVSQGMTGSTYPARQPNLLWFDETEGLTTNMSWRTPVALNDGVKPGRGYYFYVFGDIPDENDYNDVLPKQMSTSGVPNFSSGTFSYSGLNHPVTFTERANNQAAPGTYYDQNIADEGWNMIGNPSIRTLDWDQTGWTKTNIDNSIYLWDPLGNEWKTWNGFTGNMGNGLISPFQAFWVRTNNPEPELSFTDEVLTSGGYFYGGGPVAKSQSAEIESFDVKIKLNTGDQKSSVFITLTKEAVAGPDKYDAYRLEPLSDTWLEFYTLSSNAHTMPLAINALPSEGVETFNLPLFVGGQKEGNSLSGTFTLSWELPPNWPSVWTISLHDHSLQKAISMIAGDSYSFGYSAKKQVAVAGSSGDSLFSLPGDLLKPVSLQSMHKSSNQLSPFSIIIEKRANPVPSYVSQSAKLLPNYPNPFRGSTTIRFSLPETQTISLNLYDISGRYIETIEHRNYETGVHEIQWQNSSLSSGIYLLYLRTASTNDVIKLNLLN